MILSCEHTALSLASGSRWRGPFLGKVGLERDLSEKVCARFVGDVAAVLTEILGDGRGARLKRAS